MNPADLTLKKAIAGIWVRENDKLGGFLSLNSNGLFESNWTNHASNALRSWRYTGTWTVAGGICVSTITNSQSIGTTNKVPAGTVEQWKFITADERNLVWESDGQTNSLIRKK